MADDDVTFDWDQANAAHIARHAVKPEEAEQAMRNDPLDMNYEVIDGEERWTALGHTDNFRVLLLVWTLRRDTLRIVTARAVGSQARDTYLRAKGLLT
ncbi:MAG TPA: BrnT family toxin [Bryobacteraceae bacterium]|nr:BrnT family toxin [Bryobacteraceae bacterium]